MTVGFEVEGVRFEWDEEKARINWTKHRVKFEEAAFVFFDVDVLTIPDLMHSQDEDRVIAIGRSDRRVLTVINIERKEAVRIISARRATPAERKAYERRDER